MARGGYLIVGVLLLSGFLKTSCAEEALQTTAQPETPKKLGSVEVKPAGSGGSAPTTAQSPSDDDKFDGDHLTLRVNAFGFNPVAENANNQTAAKCAPKNSVIIVKSDSGTDISLRFLEVATDDGCAISDRVNNSTQYTIAKDSLRKYDYYRTGVTFGGLVAPFKFYLRGDRRVTPSSTVAPYIGFRGPAPFGLTFTPVISAGLGLIPVSNSETGKTETKSAFSTAVGVVLSQSKNQSFTSGLLFGKDFLSESDLAADPILGKPWLSIYIGYSR